MKKKYVEFDTVYNCKLLVNTHDIYFVEERNNKTTRIFVNLNREIKVFDLKMPYAEVKNLITRK